MSMFEEHFERVNESGSRISLSEEDFETLVTGGVVKQDGNQIILQDIGYSRMLEIIKNAMNK